MKALKALFTVFAAIAAFIGITFAVYYTNSDMKLVRWVYDKAQPYYDNLKKDRKL